MGIDIHAIGETIVLAGPVRVLPSSRTHKKLRAWGAQCRDPRRWLYLGELPSGFELLSVVRRRFPQIPTIAISGEFQPAVEELGVLADAFLPKPYTLKELSAKIAELLSDAPPRLTIKKDRAPVWVPRNGNYYVITCTDCLRSFSIPGEENDRVFRELRTLECILCNVLVKFIVEEKFRLIPGRTGTPAP